MVITLLGIATAPRDVQDSKAEAPMLKIAGFAANVTVDNEAAPLNKLADKSVMLAGTAMASKPDPEKAAVPIVDSKDPVANVTVVNDNKSLKASAKMLATLTPSEIETSPVP